MYTYIYMRGFIAVPGGSVDERVSVGDKQESCRRRPGSLLVTNKNHVGGDLDTHAQAGTFLTKRPTGGPEQKMVQNNRSTRYRLRVLVCLPGREVEILDPCPYLDPESHTIERAVSLQLVGLFPHVCAVPKLLVHNKPRSGT